MLPGPKRRLKIMLLFQLYKEDWWRGLDSNQRRRSQRIYSPSPLATRAPLRDQSHRAWRGSTLKSRLIRQHCKRNRPALAERQGNARPYGNPAHRCQLEKRAKTRMRSGSGRVRPRMARHAGDTGGRTCCFYIDNELRNLERDSAIAGNPSPFYGTAAFRSRTQ